MGKEEIKTGDHVWVSKVLFSDHGKMTLGLFAELEKEEKEGRFFCSEGREGNDAERRYICLC